MLHNVTVQWLKIKIESVGCAEKSFRSRTSSSVAQN